MTEPTAPAVEPVVAASGLTRHYRDQAALAGLEISVAAGELVAMLGENGSGKTTALRCLAGQLSPSAGTVRVAGADPHREPEGEAARRALAFVPDTAVFYHELTVAEHLQLVAAAFDDPAGAARGRAALDELGIGHRSATRPHELSSGQRQKALLAATAARPFAALLLDEPVLSLDPQSRAWLRAWLATQRQAGVAILLTTHDPGFAGGLADRVVRLHEGRVLADQPADAFVTEQPR